MTFSPGFQAVVTIVNTTPAATNGWTIGFALPATATVGSTFNGVMTRSGGTGTITPAAYNAVIGPGVQTFVGFGGSASPFTPPSGFTLNGVRGSCAAPVAHDPSAWFPSPIDGVSGWRLAEVRTLADLSRVLRGLR
ncbi:cellulose binding domain-containing protein [Acrocarpospora sp. B8E8]|uniref:cellulose binding domain-containing protein n=1 Tax=Acrocarpospora sp. B8E8 TaxID=3153572 RepID=UPI00325CCBFE